MKAAHLLTATVALAVLVAHPTLSAPLGTGFTYQGQLIQNGTPVNGNVDLRFSLWDAVSAGTQIGASEIVNGVSATNGLFVVVLNAGGPFGATAFKGDARWLQIEVCADPGCASTTVLTPRQPVNATPYSLHSTSPWQSSGANISFSGGNVGVGTGSPTSELQVETADQSAFRVVNNASGANPSLAGSFVAQGSTPDNRAGVFVASGPGTNYGVFLNATGGTTNYALWSENGINHFRQRVGIGTSSPSNALTVFGNADFMSFVGIGDPNPTSALTVRGAGFTGSSSALNVGNASGVSALYVGDDRKVGIQTTSPLHPIQIGGGFDGHLGLGVSDAAPNAGYIRFGDNTGWKLHLGRAREFSAGPINTTVTGAVVTIVDQGNVGIGTTSPAQRLTVVGNICAFGSIGACSDARFKDHVAPLAGALPNVLALNGVNFEWKSQDYPEMEFECGNQIGLIAQEVEKIYPEVVQTGSDGYKSVDYSRLTPALIEAIKELNAKNERLEAQLTALSETLKSLVEEKRKADRTTGAE